jgi:hypothetical protein
MNLVFQFSPSYGRPLVKTLNILVQLFATAFGAQLSIQKQGLRLRTATGYFDIMPTMSNTTLSIQVGMPSSPDLSDVGMATTLLMAYRLLVAENSSVTYQEGLSSFANTAIVTPWGRYALKRVVERFPKESKTIVSDVLAESLR